MKEREGGKAIGMMIEECIYKVKVSMVWYGMVWYGMVWYGMEWYGVAWRGVAWRAMLCYAMLCYAMLCYAMLCYAIDVRYAIVYLIHSVATMAWYSMTRKGDVRYGKVYIWCGACGRTGEIWYGTARLGELKTNLVA